MGYSAVHSISQIHRHPDPLLLYDPDTFEITKANNRALELFGLSADAIGELTIRELKFPNSDHQLYQKLQEATPKEESIYLGNFSYQTENGEPIELHANARLLRSNGEKYGILHIREQNSPHNLQEKENYKNRQEQLYNNPLALVRFDRNLTIVEWSDRAEEKTGYHREKVLGKSVFDIGLFDDDEVANVKERFQKFQNGKNRDRFETVIKLKNGETIHVLLHVSAQHSDNGELKSILAFIQNIDVRKQYVKHLKDREKRYHRLFEHASDAIALLDGQTIVDCNSKLVDLLEIEDKENIIGQSILEFSSQRLHNGKDQEIKFESSIDKANGGNPQIFKWHCFTSQGNKKFVEISMQKLSFEDGDYLEAVIRNLTKREKAQEKLNKEQKRLKNAQKLADLGWWHYDLQGDCLTLSETLLDILNLNEENFDFDLESFKQIVHTDDRGKVDSIIKKAKQTSSATDYFLRINKPESDDIIYTHGRATTEFNQYNKAVALSGVLQDVTDYRKAQKKLTRQKELFESLFLDSPVAIAMINTEGKVRKVNDSFEDLFGYSENELIGKDLLEFQLPDERQDKVQEFYDALFEGTPSLQYIQDQRFTRHGDEKHLIIASVPVSIDGEPIAAFDIYTDITKLRKTEQVLQESLKEKEILLSEIHHRVKNNLAIISGLLELEAMNWEENSTIHNVLTESKMRIHSMASIHEQLYESKDFSNISIGRYISDLVDSISDTINRQDKDIDINVNTDDILLNINQALPCALIINELVTHAYQNAFEGNKYGDLDIAFSQDNDTIALIIDDGGPGLPDDFEQMVEESLGHRLVKQLVKQLEGKIEVDNNKTGTRYKITFQKDNKKGSAASQIIEGKN